MMMVMVRMIMILTMSTICDSLSARIFSYVVIISFVKGGCGDDGEGQCDNDDGNGDDDYDFDDELHPR